MINTIKNLIKKLFSRRIIRYLFSGSIIFSINILIAFAVFKIPVANQSWLTRNIANVIVIELAILSSFPIHNFFTWEQDFTHFFNKLFKYHLIMVTGIIIRTAIFGIMDYMGHNWFISTVSGIAVVICYNFFGFDKFVFNKKTTETTIETT